MFILLIFFVMAGRFSEETRLVLRSAVPPSETAASSPSSASSPTALVEVDRDGVLGLAGRVVQPDELAESLPDGAAVVLRLAPELSVETMVAVIDGLRQAGVERLSYLPRAAD